MRTRNDAAGADEPSTAGSRAEHGEQGERGRRISSLPFGVPQGGRGIAAARLSERTCERLRVVAGTIERATLSEHLDDLASPFGDAVDIPVALAEPIRALSNLVDPADDSLFAALARLAASSYVLTRVALGGPQPPAPIETPTMTPIDARVRALLDRATRLDVAEVDELFDPVVRDVIARLVARAEAGWPATTAKTALRMASLVGLGVAVAEFEISTSPAPVPVATVLAPPVTTGPSGGPAGPWPGPARPAEHRGPPASLDELESRRIDLLRDLDDLGRERDDLLAGLAMVDAEIRARTGRRVAEDVLSARTLRILSSVVLPPPVVLAACGVHDGQRQVMPDNVLRAIASLVRIRLDDGARQPGYDDDVSVGALGLGHRFGRYLFAGASQPDPAADLTALAERARTIDGAGLVATLHPTTRAGVQAFAMTCVQAMVGHDEPAGVAAFMASFGEGLALAALEIEPDAS